MIDRFAIVLVVSLAACGSSVPQTRYYALTPPPVGGRADAADRGLALAVEPLDAAPAYDEDRIVYRLTPYRLDYYNYHRWSSPPGELVAAFLASELERSGAFSSVTENTAEAPLTLGGRILALEEVDRSKTAWFGRLVLELTLTDSETGEVLWARQFEEVEPLTEQSPEGLARALSVALDRVARQVVPVATEIATETMQRHGTQVGVRATRSRRD